jgi:hypothetical protein
MLRSSPPAPHKHEEKDEHRMGRKWIKRFLGKREEKRIFGRYKNG